MWTKNFQMFELRFRKGRGTEIKLPTSVGSLKTQESSRKTSSALLTTLKPLTVRITTNYGKFWKRWDYQTILPASWEICIQVKKQHLEPDMELIPIRKRSMSRLSPWLFNLYAEYIMWNARLDEAQAEIKIAGRNINNLRYADDTLWQKAKKN